MGIGNGGFMRKTVRCVCLGGPRGVSGVMAALRTVGSREEQCAVTALGGPGCLSGLMTALGTVGSKGGGGAV